MGNPRLENVASQKFRSLLGSHQRLSSAACLLLHRMNVNNNPENDRKVRWADSYTVAKIHKFVQNPETKPFLKLKPLAS